MGLSCNPNLTLEFVEKHIDNDWDWSILSKSPMITMELIESNIELNWDWSSVSENPNLTCEFFEKHIDKEWNFVYISRNDFLFEFKSNYWFHVNRKKRLKIFKFDLKIKICVKYLDLKN